MKDRAHQPWKVQRQLVATADGQRRWDRAYQHLLSWTSVPAPATKEAEHERGHLRAGFQLASSPGRDD